MRQKAICIIILIFFSIPSLDISAQQPGTEEILEDLFSRILNTRSNDERIRINDSINLLIEKYVASEVIFTHRFENLRYLGQIPSPDSRVKIVTWNLILTDGTNRYFCYIIRKEGQGRENKIYRLTGANMDEAPKTDITYTADDWYGALYYGIQPFRIGKETCYAVLGLDYGSLQLSRKIIDVMSFSEEGDIIFGRKCFQKEDQLRSRVVLEYSADGVMTLRFNDKKTIIFDRLAPVNKGQGINPEYYGTEFSFDAYKLKKGLWRFVKNVEVKNRQ